jgi:tetratricopeptide (TPR) repeat protein
VPSAQAPLSVMALTDLGLAALARGDREVGNRHLEVAQRWVDQLLASNPNPSAPLRRFARKWYLAMIWLRFARAEGPDASKLLEVARAKFPADPEVLLSSGTFEAMEITRDRVERGGGRHRADRDSRVNSYGLSAPQVQVIRASGYFRDAIKLDPNNAEARLRLAWLRFTTQSLEFSGELTLLKEARALAPKPPLSYLAALFAGRIEEELKHLDAAALWYRTAIAECPLAQTARLGLSHIQLDQNEIVASRNTLRPLIGRSPKEDYVCEPDPWRVYEFGQSWRLTDWIVAMRKEVREPAEGSQP